VARPETRYDEFLARLAEAAEPHRPAPEPFRTYLETVRRNASAVTDADVRALKDAGFSDEVIFEQTVSVAVAAGLERLAAGLEVLP
jgi:hypothetical protein